MTEWMKKFYEKENQAEFSELVHHYYKLATIRVMQIIREKYDVPPDETQTLVLAIVSRLLNESCYAVGSAVKNGMSIEKIYSKEHLLNLVRVLNGEGLDQLKRKDIDADIQSGLTKFKEFIVKNAEDFYI